MEGIEREEEALSAKKALCRLNNLDRDQLVPIEEAFKEAGWIKVIKKKRQSRTD
ncbi:MAG: hypothetical protein ACK5MA_05220 [Parachlamydiaceae bacterium]